MERLIAPGQDAAAKRRRCSPETRREEILRAAVTLFASHGFTRTTTREIAQAAHIAEGTIYKYFASKEELLFAFLQPLMSISLANTFPLDSEPDDAAIIRTFLCDRFAVWERHRELMKVVLSEALFNALLSDGLSALLQSTIVQFAQYLAGRMADGVFLPMNPTVASRGLLGQAFAHFLQASLLGTPPESTSYWEEIAESLTMLFLHGMVVRDAERPQAREGGG